MRGGELLRTRGAKALAIGIGALGAAYVGARFAATLAAARRRVAAGSEVIRTAFGDLEYAIEGEGPRLLMIHGTGGGFDQGLALSEGIIRRGHQVIAPSRFGYLRSDYPSDPSSERQADAFAELLDHLRIDRIAVGGGSAGALSAAQFALRHPDRCSALILLVPAANVTGRDPVQMSPLQDFVVRRLAASDFLFWTALRTVPNQMVATLLATDPEQIALAGPEERRRALRILEEIMPISSRSKGMLNDARLAGHPARMDFSRIVVPTLVISVEDDRFGTANTARKIASVVPNVRLTIYPSGGHIWVGHEGDVADEITAFLAAEAE